MPELPTQPTPPRISIPQQPINGQRSGLAHKSRFKRLLPWLLGGIGGLIVLIIAAAIVWYNVELSPKSAPSKHLVRVVVASGDSPTVIGELLQSNGVIRNGFAFQLYTELTGKAGKLQAGTYHLSPSDRVQTIVHHLTSGAVDTFEVTFLPGATEKQDRTVLQNAGYTADEINAGLTADYTSTVLANKPAGSSLEGYLYGDTYDFNAGASVNAIVTRVLAQLQTEVDTANLVNAYKSHGLTLYQGITLASIVQKEVSNSADQKQVAQVFYSRLSLGMPLGSDVTYMYGAQLLGVTPSPTLDSPYNTRIHTGLPPGPISNPGQSALEAVAHPASGTYLYFLAGDDGKTHFATTDAQHEANVAKYCQQNCG